MVENFPINALGCGTLAQPKELIDESSLSNMLVGL